MLLTAMHSHSGRRGRVLLIATIFMFGSASVNIYCLLELNMLCDCASVNDFIYIYFIDIVRTRSGVYRHLLIFVYHYLISFVFSFSYLS